MKQIDGIKDNGIYLSSMQKTFADKSWFVDKLPFNVTSIVDFGCADGSFGTFLKSVCPFPFSYIGIDNNLDFFNMIKENGGTPFVSLEELVKANVIDPDSTLLVLNSVLHEIYSYADIDQFWKDVKKLNPRMIAFRDMYVGNCGRYNSSIQRDIQNAVVGNFMERHYNDFISYWGTLTDGYKAVHFLLKYFYDANWEREMKEYYVPYSYRELHEKIRSIGYCIQYDEFYALPYLISKWQKDFDCTAHSALKSFLNAITTHLKLLMLRDD